jgi:preprotein translocase subunit SecF
MLAVAMAALGILIYIWFVFRQVPNAFRYGTAAIVAMLHDVLVVLGLESIFGFAFGWQVDSLFLTALLNVIGFSVHDTIVVFDRIRENISSIVAISSRSSITVSSDARRWINTQLMVMFPCWRWCCLAA